MDLVPYTDADRWLIEALETDPAVMAELGGPWPLDEIPGIHRRRLAYVAKGAWYFTIVPEPGARAVGSVNLWHSEWNGTPVSEAGWMVLPEHQGRGYATAAVRLLLERARADGQWGDIHAFTGVANVASNALCRKVGFQLDGEADIEYGGRSLRCRHWIWPVTGVG
jgi:RimJ/RimL family protein N-acetyltransferase